MQLVLEKDLAKNSYGFFMLFYMSHGSNRIEVEQKKDARSPKRSQGTNKDSNVAVSYVLDCEGNPMRPYEDFAAKFTGQACSNLRDKPKIFMFQV